MRRAGLDLVGNFTRRVEPLWLRGHDRLLSLGIYAVTRILAPDRVSPGRSMSKPAPHRLPGDPPLTAEIARMLRVDHAGEFGATRIYEGQLDVLGRGRAAGVIRGMAEAEKRHLARFDALLRERRVRPTLLHPVWSIAGYALGAATALLGERAAMACTVAVEEVIDEHYQQQAEKLGDQEPALFETIRSFRDDELAHRDLALSHGAKETPAYDLISAAVKTGSRIAIWLSTRF
jgi:3-demethoxyubiquinol 3-hydroxylase